MSSESVPKKPASPPSESTVELVLDKKFFPQHSLRSVILEWVVILTSALILALVIKVYVMQTFYIPSESMERTLLVNDKVLVNKTASKWNGWWGVGGGIRHGDVIVFSRPSNLDAGPEVKDLIKRVVGLPGDTVEGRNGYIFVNGTQIDEPYVYSVSGGTDWKGPAVDDGPIRLGSDEYFVLGDHRDRSDDGRVFGPITKDQIVGKAFVRFWPLGRFGGL